jgi:hypothetical protein
MAAGTGNEEPNRRNLFYALLEEAGFHFRWFRTDYRFVDWDEAIALTRFFFGNKVQQASCLALLASRFFLPLLACCGGQSFLIVDRW